MTATGTPIRCPVDGSLLHFERCIDGANVYVCTRTHVRNVNGVCGQTVRIAQPTDERTSRVLTGRWQESEA